MARAILLESWVSSYSTHLPPYFSPSIVNPINQSSRSDDSATIPPNSWQDISNQEPQAAIDHLKTYQCWPPMLVVTEKKKQ